VAISIHDIPFFKGLPDKELEEVRQCLREKSFEKGQTLFLEGASCDRVFFVRSGRVKIYRIASNGREQTLETLENGDTCACNPGEARWTCSSSAEALTACTVWFLSREHYVRLVRTNTRLAQSLNRLFAERLQCFSALIEEVSLKDSRKRVAKFLLDLITAADRKSGTRQAVVSLAFTREELAQRIGIVRETAARQLNALQRLKLIEIQPHQIVVRDRQGLEKLLER